MSLLVLPFLSLLKIIIYHFISYLIISLDKRHHPFLSCRMLPHDLKPLNNKFDPYGITYY